jgi:hypothetical protein
MTGKDLLGRLADAGEEAVAKLAESPGGERLLNVANSLKDRMDELQRRVRGIEALEQRVAELEKRLASLEGAKPATKRRTATKPARGKASTTRARTSRSGAPSSGAST